MSNYVISSLIAEKFVYKILCLYSREKRPLAYFRRYLVRLPCLTLPWSKLIPKPPVCTPCCECR